MKTILQGNAFENVIYIYGISTTLFRSQCIKEIRNYYLWSPLLRVFIRHIGLHVHANIHGYGDIAKSNYILRTSYTERSIHDDVIKWKHFPRYWTFVWGIHRSPVISPHKGQ